MINRWRNDPEIIGLLGNNFLYISNDVDAAWFEQYLLNRDKARRFAIVDTASGLMIGTTQLTGIHAINQSAEFSIAIGDKSYWNKGAGYTAACMVLDHGFKDLNLHRIWLTVLVKNQRAIRLYEKIGFKSEGIQRHCVYKLGAFEDQAMMSVLKEEYLQPQAAAAGSQVAPAYPLFSETA